MEIIICPACKKEFSEKIENCNRCKFPFNGTEKERGIHIGKFIGDKGVIIDSEDSIKKSQNILYAIGGLNVLMIILQIAFDGFYMIDFVLNMVISATFLFCGYYIFKNPIKLTVIPLILIIAINILNFLIDPNTLTNGLLIKIVIIGALVYSIYLIKSAENFKKEYDLE